MRVTRLFFFFGLILLGLSSSAQFRQQSSFLDKIYFGGGGGFSVGTDFTNVSVSPLVGYKITDRFSAGIFTSYQYVRYLDFRLSNFGGGPFARFNVTDRFFTYTEYEHMNFEFPTRGTETVRQGFNSWFVGLGYTEPIGNVLAFHMMALYNVLYRDGSNSPYDSPISFRVGLLFRLF